MVDWTKALGAGLPRRRGAAADDRREPEDRPDRGRLPRYQGCIGVPCRRAPRPRGCPHGGLEWEDGQSYDGCVKQLARAAGLENAGPEQIARFDRKRKKTMSNREWKYPHDGSARIGRMKDGRTRMAHEAEYAVDTETAELVREDPLAPRLLQRIHLQVEVLLASRYPRIADQHALRPRPQGSGSPLPSGGYHKLIVRKSIVIYVSRWIAKLMHNDLARPDRDPPRRLKTGRMRDRAELRGNGRHRQPRSSCHVLRPIARWPRRVQPFQVLKTRGCSVSSRLFRLLRIAGQPYSAAPTESREGWTAYVRQARGERGFSWGYWEFGAGFGVYDRDAGQCRRGLLEALLPDSPELQRSGSR
jgi:hypothetical protein